MTDIIKVSSLFHRKYMAKLGPSSLPYKIIFGALQFKCTWFGFSKVYFVVQYTSCQLQIDAATQMQKITCA